MHKKKCQALSQSVTLRAKAMDPHKSLEEVFRAKLKENRSVSHVSKRCQSWDSTVIGLENGKMELLEYASVIAQSQRFCQALRNLQSLWELLCLIGMKHIFDWKKNLF